MPLRSKRIATVIRILSKEVMFKKAKVKAISRRIGGMSENIAREDKKELKMYTI